ncbi:P-loop ATPase, Sll1717 family [Sphingosinicella rhizophila]|uniref:DNA repair ATPase n=1 Tax=Sphingosinicella rhizophila TaxID=3050082 RepID=A0ABU3QCG0_9SPHN|nr:DNA repair ATPase [Sphingosinicella sp. GR2756]MDT9601085.1 DNA repair ATPase [Sphingosinicella sp. GR2756]
MATIKQVNPVVLRRGAGIGTGNAETDDDFLFDCFVEYPPVEECRRATSPVMVVAGRTGSGKTAILRYLERETHRSTSLDPFEMSMSYVSNSDALRFLNAIGADLDLFFQVLWKHVLCIEYIRLRWDVDSADKSRNIFSKLFGGFLRDERKQKSLEYIKDWQGKFWITMDQNIKEITESVERKLHAEIGVEIEKFKAGGQYDKRMSREKKSEIVARTRKIISSDQLSELHGVIEMLATQDVDVRTYYLTIDRLDERWVDDSVRFRMIKGLMESLKTFRKIRNLKILVALREDVLERVVQETADISFQREKFEDLMVRLRWTRAELRQLVDKRLNSLFKRQYTVALIGFSDIFPPKIGAKDTFEWMTERTLMRPRDVIALVNECIDIANGQPSVSVTAVRKAEVDFARKRRDALLQEWRSAYPLLGRVLDLFTSRRKSGVDLIELMDKVDDFCTQTWSSPRIDHDPVWDLCQAYAEGGKKMTFDVLAELAAILYRAGGIGIKISAQDRFAYAHIDQPLISPQLLSPDSKVRLHPMLHAAYNLQDRQ